jgi:phosphoglycerol transferase MdoB-like AlkP superfamily enzyme
LNQTPQPFVSCCFTLSSHHPYNIPERYKNSFYPGTLPIHASIQYADHALRKFFETASKMPWFDNTLFVIVADHTAQAEGTYYKNRVGMYDIPIVFYRSNGELKGERSVVAQQADILPTVLDYLNFRGKHVAFGSSLFDPNRPRYAFSYLNGVYQIVGPQYCLQFDGRKTIGLYRYHEDLTLSINHAGQGLAEERELEEALKAAIQQFNYGLIHNKLLPR